MTAGNVQTYPRIILASASERRRDLLAAAGISFDVDPPRIAETRLADERPESYVERMAREKARVGVERHPTRIVLAADTVVLIGDTVLGKPIGAQNAVAMLRTLSGRPHVVMTAVAVAASGLMRSDVARTTVWMRPLHDDEVHRYVATGEPLDKAGAYAIQGGARDFVERIDGALDTVIGLPIALVQELLRGATTIPPP